MSRFSYWNVEQITIDIPIRRERWSACVKPCDCRCTFSTLEDAPAYDYIITSCIGDCLRMKRCVGTVSLHRDIFDKYITGTAKFEKCRTAIVKVEITECEVRDYLTTYSEKVIYPIGC